jgi:hypothetical protein
VNGREFPKMEWDEDKLLLNIRDADTDDLLDRVTAFRAGMEPEAIDLIERELHRRGVTAAQMQDQAEVYGRECVFDANGIAKMCSICRRPAVREGWGWHKILGMLPIFPRWLHYCKVHQAPP